MGTSEYFHPLGTMLANGASQTWQSLRETRASCGRLLTVADIQPVEHSHSLCKLHDLAPADQGTTNHPKPGGEGAMPAFSRRLVAGAPLKIALSESSKRAKPPVRNDADVGNPLRYAQQHLLCVGTRQR